MSKYIVVNNCIECGQWHKVPKENKYMCEGTSPIQEITDLSSMPNNCPLPNMPKTFDEAIAVVEGLYNSYPKIVFKDLPNGFFRELDKFCKTHGFPIDRLSGDYGRHFMALTLERLKETR